MRISSFRNMEEHITVNADDIEDLEVQVKQMQITIADQQKEQK